MQNTCSNRAGTASVHPRIISPPIFEEKIAGRFRPIPTRQLCLAWWLYGEKHITRRQLRIYFAAHEMAERRRYAQDTNRRPHYTVQEVAGLVGGKKSSTALAELASDVRKLARLGLVAIEPGRIVFASSIEQLDADIESADFSAFVGRIPNLRRSTPVPRRMLRALAAGFSRAVTAVVLALVIRSLFWRAEEERFRVDGRTKGSWIAEVFGVSRRAVTDARAHLIELGWIEPLETSQWELNRWGNRDRIRLDWSMPKAESASLGEENTGESASPIFNKKASSSRNLETISSALGIIDRAGDDRKEEIGETERREEGPNIRRILPEDLRSTDRLMALYRQAVDLRMADDCRAGMLDFFALAERARARGRRLGALFYWLVRERKSEFITQADEDAAAERLREFFDGERATSPPAAAPDQIPEDLRYVYACIRAAKAQRIADPYTIAQAARNWTRQYWDECLALHREAGELGQAVA